MPNGRRPQSEKRDTASLDGLLDRARFQKSLDMLQALGLSAQAIDCYRRFARITRKLPHELVREVAEQIAKEWRTAQDPASMSGRPPESGSGQPTNRPNPPRAKK